MSTRGSYQKRTYRKWSIEEKRAAVARLGVCTARALAEELGVARSLLKTWREQIQALDKKEHREQSKERALERENLRLKQALATKVLEADFFKGIPRLRSRLQQQLPPAQVFFEQTANPTFSLCLTQGGHPTVENHCQAPRARPNPVNHSFQRRKPQKLFCMFTPTNLI